MNIYRFVKLGGLCCLTTVCLSTPVSASTLVLPGSVVQLQQYQETCARESSYAGSLGSNDTPPFHITYCSASSNTGGSGDAWPGSDYSQARVVVKAELTGRAYERATSTGTVEAGFRVAESLSTSSNLVKAKVSTEIAYGGTLGVTLPFAGVEPAYASIVMTLQVRDLQTNQVVASNTFVEERIHFDAAAELDAGDSNYIKGTTGADVLVLIKRGQEYQVEVEAVCQAEVPKFAFGTVYCDFNVDDRNDGMWIKPITISVADDEVEKISENFDDLQDSMTQILNKMATLEQNIATVNDNLIQHEIDVNAEFQTVKGDISNVLIEVVTVKNNVEENNQAILQLTNILNTHDMDIEDLLSSHDVDVKALLSFLQQGVDTNYDGLLEIIRLLHVPTGSRDSNYNACRSGPCDFPEK